MRWLRDKFLPTASLMVFMSAVGCATVILSAPAKADPISARATQYAAQHYRAVCDNLKLLPDVESVETIVIQATRDGLTGAESGQAVAVAVTVACPEFGYLLDAFAAKWAPATPPVSAGVGVQRVGGVIR